MRFKLDKWDYAIISIILVNLILLIYRWDMFPKFIDIYYHFSVAKAFELSNGIVFHDFWEYAPAGRPHLYPPFFPIIIVILAKLGLKIEFLLKLISLAMFPLLQITSWLIFRKLFNKKTAFYIVLLLTSSYSFYWFQANMMPASLVIMFSIIIYYLVEKDKFISASLLLALSLYTHLGMSLIIVLSLIIYAFLSKKIKIISKILVIATILFSPWLVFALQNIAFFNLGDQTNFLEWKLHLLLLLFAVPGFYYCIKSKNYIPISYAIAMVAFLFFYPSIYFSGHNLFSWSLLGGIFLANIDKKFTKNKKYMLIIILIITLLLTPVLVIPKDDGKLHTRLDKGTLTNLIFFKPTFEDLNMLTPQNLELVDYISKNTEANEIFYVGNAYIGGLITTFTGRSQNGAMYTEIKPIKAPEPRNAEIWISDIRDPEPPEEYELITQLSAYKIYRTDEKPERKIPALKIPLIYAYIALIIAALIIYFDLKRIQS